MGEAKRKKNGINLPGASRQNRFGAFAQSIKSKGCDIILNESICGFEFASLDPSLYADENFNLPSYDFGETWNQNDSPEMANDALGSLNASINLGAFHLPHPDFFMMFDLGIGVNRALVVVNAVQAGAKIEFYFWTAFGRIWIKHTITGQFDPSTGQGAVKSSRSSGATEISTCQMYMKQALASIALLIARPDEEIIEAEELPARATIDRAKQMFATYPTRLIRLHPLGATRLKAITQRQAAERNGTPRCPHNRRGHERVYKKTGKRIWINETKIKGGSPIPRPAVVQVLH